MWSREQNFYLFSIVECLTNRLYMSFSFSLWSKKAYSVFWKLEQLHHEECSVTLFFPEQPVIDSPQEDGKYRIEFVQAETELKFFYKKYLKKKKAQKEVSQLSLLGHHWLQ